jgi:hypothetical protein
MVVLIKVLVDTHATGFKTQQLNSYILQNFLQNWTIIDMKLYHTFKQSCSIYFNFRTKEETFKLRAML